MESIKITDLSTLKRESISLSQKRNINYALNLCKLAKQYGKKLSYKEALKLAWSR